MGMIETSISSVVGNCELDQPVTSLKGIGPRRAELLAQKGVLTLLDLLFFTPVRYEDRTQIMPIGDTCDGVATWVKGQLEFAKEERVFRNGRRLFRAVIKDRTGNLEIVWFHYKKAHLSHILVKGVEVMAYGVVRNNRGKRQMVHPDLSAGDGDKKGLLKIYPVYPVIRGVSGHTLRLAVRQVVEQYQGGLVDVIPENLIRGLGLPGLGEAVRCLHEPPEGSSVDLLNRLKTVYHQRLTFDRFFCVMLNMAYKKSRRKTKVGQVFSIPKGLVQQFERHVPFCLTKDQKRVINEIVQDFKSGKPMNRLLQGDVGCGKTIVAAVAAYVAISNKWQVALMVPSQVLARQHNMYFSALSKAMGFRVILLTAALNRSERLKAYECIKRGDYNLIIGTQALIQEELSFARLGLVIIDEQHRFGVRQRALLNRKGENPHLLVMTATPLPRTIAMTVYADLDTSIIRQYPEGHKPVKTFLMHEDQKREVYNIVTERLSSGQQIIVICPVVEESEELDLKNALEMFEKLGKLFGSRFHVGLIHGRLNPDEKDRVMQDFQEGLIDLLVATTVIEVGVHVPGASVMVVEHPERFGLAQLHQLRGRVGRGSEQGFCFLMLGKRLSEGVPLRLSVLVETNDGFEIAERDLEIRGHGELMGLRQSGAGELDYAEMFREPELLVDSKKAAEKLIDSDPELSSPGNHMLREMLLGAQQFSF